MKKSIIAFIMGAVLATAGSAYAADIATLIGKPIEGEIPVKVNGETLDKKAIFVDGTSYLPVRAIGDALNMNVGYDADLGVELTPKEETMLDATTEGTSTEIPIETKVMTPEDVEAIKSSEEQIILAEQRINELQSKIAKVDEDILAEQEKLNAATSDSDKMYYSENIKIMNSDKISLNESLKAAQDSIPAQRAFIEKIKKKYE